MGQLNVVELRKIAEENETAGNVFKYLAKRERGREDSDVRRIIRLLREHNVKVVPEDVKSTFEKLQALGVGRLVYGRGGQPTRFHWFCNLVDVGKAAEGATSEVRAEPIKTVKKYFNTGTEIQAKAEAMITIRKNGVEVDLPASALSTDTLTDIISAIDVFEAI